MTKCKCSIKYTDPECKAENAKHLDECRAMTKPVESNDSIKTLSDYIKDAKDSINDVVISCRAHRLPMCQIEAYKLMLEFQAKSIQELTDCLLHASSRIALVEADLSLRNKKLQDLQKEIADNEKEHYLWKEEMEKKINK